MKEEQQEDPILKLTYKQITAGEKLKTSAITKVKSKVVRKYFLQFDWLTLRKGVLHHLYINNDVEYHQMILPIEYKAQVLCLLHDGQGHLILLEYHVLRYNKLCKKLSMLPNCEG